MEWEGTFAVQGMPRGPCRRPTELGDREMRAPRDRNSRWGGTKVLQSAWKLTGISSARAQGCAGVRLRQGTGGRTRDSKVGCRLPQR